MRYIDFTPLHAKKDSWSKGKKNSKTKKYEKWTCTKLRDDFKSLVGKKCWYSETLINGSDAPIDHFRPKGKITPFEDFEYNIPLNASGYYWLSEEYTNYRQACTFSNRKTDNAGKGSYFPLLTNTYLTENGNEAEKPVLLDPCIKDDVQLLSFFAGGVYPIYSDNTHQGNIRAKASINIYNLNHNDFTQARDSIWNTVENAIEEYKNGDRTANSLKNTLTKLTAKIAPFSACAISAVLSLLADEEDLLQQLGLELEL